MGVKLNVSTHQQQCFAGDEIQGVVRLDVTSNQGSLADKLMLRLVGLAKTRIIREHTDSSTTKHVQKNKFLSHEIKLASFGGIVTAGSHSFPFSVMLPPGLPSSMKEKRSNLGDCSIAYTFKAHLHRPGILNFDSKAKSELKVFSKPREIAAAMPVLVGPETQTVKTCCFFNSGSMSIGFEADRSVVGINKPVRLTVVARNDSTSSVQSMHIEIVQVCTWFARGHKEKKTRTVASMKVSGAQLGEVLRTTAKRDITGRNPAAEEGAARKHLQQLLAAGAGTRHELSVSDDSLLTLQTSLIDVRHSLNVRLKFPALTSSPDVSMPLRVQAEAVEL